MIGIYRFLLLPGKAKIAKTKLALESACGRMSGLVGKLQEPANPIQTEDVTRTPGTVVYVCMLK